MSGETDNQLGEQVVNKWCCNIPPPPLESLGAHSLAEVTRSGQCLVRSPLVVIHRVAFHFFELRFRVCRCATDDFRCLCVVFFDDSF